MYYLDTNTCIYFLNGTYESIRTKLLSMSPGEISIPVVVKAELLYGAYKSTNRKPNLEKLERFLEAFEVASFEDPMTYEYASIRSETEAQGQPIGPNDLFIAAIVRFHEGILVTNNIKEFGRVKNLRTENWVIES